MTAISFLLHRSFQTSALFTYFHSAYQDSQQDMCIRIHVKELYMFQNSSMDLARIVRELNKMKSINFLTTNNYKCIYIKLHA